MEISTVAASNMPDLRPAAHFFPRAFAALFDFRVTGVSLIFERQKQIDQPFLRAGGGFFAESGRLFLLDHADGDFEKVADHRFDIAADVADFGEFGRFDFDEWSAGKAGKAAGDFGFADAGGSDHENIFGDDGLRESGGKLLPTPAIADGDGDRAFSGGLANDVLVEFGDNLLRG